MMTKISRRRFFGSVTLGSAAVGSLLTFPAPALIGGGSNDKIRLGVIGCGGRGGDVSGELSRLDEIDVVALADPDSNRVGKLGEVFPTAKKFADLRKIIDDPNIDAVLVATCNHWHCLAAVWAMQAGKDVYVEKPLAHRQWEGQQVVKAAKKYGRVCQVGTQQRSDPMQAEIKKFLHEEKAIGEILSCAINHYSPRNPIGKRKTPLAIPKEVDYNLWLGPASDQPLFRDKLQYDWHWDWNTGNGEMGNWGVHVIDDVINNVVLDKVPLPKGILAGGARVAYNDAGQTPNISFVYFDIGAFPIVFGLSTLGVKDDPRSAGKHDGPASGNIVYCEGGRLEAQRGLAIAFDQDGKEIRSFSGTTGQAQHARNFVDAVLARDPSILNAPAEIGNSSSGWCNMANIAFLAGAPYRRADVAKLTGTRGLWEDALDRLNAVVESHGIDMEKDFRMSPYLAFDQEKEIFTGEGADRANSFLKREYRPGFEFPEEV